ncbi:hypothetical protein NQ318_005351 [Aromia moschata]|uniref:BSD domain-containing protein n=1 Tax=Aromia moschata TaxID=1265417 RepID=A0AAV8YY34_9CUCU|nr:hypothetical protein NQ318_005351 [Aromia moschata]
MAEKSDNWFGSWLNAAKNKKKIKVAKVNLGISGQMNTVLNPSPDDSDTEILIVENSETVKLTKMQKAIYELQKDPTTYLCDPEPELSKQFQCWLEIIGDQLSDDRIAKHVNSSEVLSRQYAKLVPDVIEHQLFWKRYLFKKALLEDDIARQEALDRREQKDKVITEDNVNWEQEDFSNGIELTEEEQIKLLEQILFKQETAGKDPAVTKSRGKASDLKLKRTDSSAVQDAPSSSSSTDGDWEKISDVEK